MTPPIRVRRRRPNPSDQLRGGRFSRFLAAEPWIWTCLRCGPFPFGYATTHAAALDAGLAHLNTHTETR